MGCHRYRWHPPFFHIEFGASSLRKKKQSEPDSGLEWSSDYLDLAPQVGLEPTTLRLTAECSAIELLRNVLLCEQDVLYAKAGELSTLFLKKYEKK